MRQFFPALVVFIVLSVIVGVLYPAVTTLSGQTLFPEQANGSLIFHSEKVIGSKLISFSQNKNPQYFQSRPSAAILSPEGILIGSASNIAQSNPKFRADFDARRTEFETKFGVFSQAPADMFFASASGLDRNISITAAMAQAEKISEARNISSDFIKNIIVEHAIYNQILRQNYVSVVELNSVLDQEFGIIGSGS